MARQGDTSTRDIPPWPVRWSAWLGRWSVNQALNSRINGRLKTDMAPHTRETSGKPRIRDRSSLNARNNRWSMRAEKVFERACGYVTERLCLRVGNEGKDTHPSLVGTRFDEMG